MAFGQKAQSNADLVVQILTALFAGLGTVLFSRILYFYLFRRTSLRVQKLSGCLISYLTYSMFGMFIHALTYFYLFTRSAKVPVIPSALENVYKWLANFSNIAYYTLGLSVLLLALDRCLVIQLANKYTPKMNFALFSAHLICNPGLLILGFFVDFSRNIGGLPITLWVLNGLKLTAGILNTCLSGFLIWKIRRSTATINDAVVRNMTILDVCLEFIPSIPVYIIDQLEVKSQILEFLWYPSLPFLTQCLNFAICGILYNRTLLKRNIKITIVNNIAANQSNNSSWTGICNT